MVMRWFRSPENSVRFRMTAPKIGEREMTKLEKDMREFCQKRNTTPDRVLELLKTVQKKNGIRSVCVDMRK